jgi:hypothetical protein
MIAENILADGLREEDWWEEEIVAMTADPKTA